MFHSEIPSGKLTEPKSLEYEDLALGGGVVLNLISVVGSPTNHAIYFDNFFYLFNFSVT